MNRAVRAASIGILLLTPVALSACSAGQMNQTSTQLRDKTGPMGTVGDIVLRQVQVAYPPKGRYSPGDDVELQLAIVNSATTPDTLISINGDGFRGVRLGGTTPSTGASPSAGTAPSTGASPSGGTAPSGTAPSGTAPSGTAPSGTAPSTGGSPSGSVSAATSVPASPPPPGAAPGAGPAATSATSAATATALPGAPAASSSAPAPAPSSSVSLPIPPNSTVFLGRGAPRITLVGLTQPLTPAQSLRLTFTFQRAGTVTVPALVAEPTGELTRSSSFDFEQTPSESAGNRG